MVPISAERLWGEKQLPQLEVKAKAQATKDSAPLQQGPRRFPGATHTRYGCRHGSALHTHPPSEPKAKSLSSKSAVALIAWDFMSKDQLQGDPDNPLAP